MVYSAPEFRTNKSAIASMVQFWCIIVSFHNRGAGARVATGITAVESRAWHSVDVARLRVSIVFESGARIGPGKAKLLESIRDTGLISAVARDMGMSHKRAWLLIGDCGAGWLGRRRSNPDADRSRSARTLSSPPRPGGGRGQTLAPRSEGRFASPGGAENHDCREAEIRR